MVNASGNEVELRLVVDRATIESQLSGGFDTSTAKSPKKGAAGRQGAKVAPGPAFMKIFKPLAALEIIKFGIKMMVKNSKVLSTTMGAFGAIMGAILDLLLIAFMPIIVKVLGFLVKHLPDIQKWIQVAADWLTKKGAELYQWFKTNWPAFMIIFKGISQPLIDLYVAIQRLNDWLNKLGSMFGIESGGIQKQMLMNNPVSDAFTSGKKAIESITTLQQKQEAGTTSGTEKAIIGALDRFFFGSKSYQAKQAADKSTITIELATGLKGNQTSGKQQTHILQQGGPP